MMKKLQLPIGTVSQWNNRKSAPSLRKSQSVPATSFLNVLQHAKLSSLPRFVATSEFFF